MKLLLAFLFSFYFTDLFASSCCVSNTSVSNLMILPAQWQQTFGFSQNRVIGDVDEKGQSTFRRKTNKDVTNLGRMDLSYAWTFRYQTGVSLKYQNRNRDLNGSESSDAGWNDVGLSHAFRPLELERIWIFQTLNIPTATSAYDSNSAMAVDARGSGHYLSSIGVFGILNFKEWDVTYTPEVHYSFGRTFKNTDTTTEVDGFWGASMAAGIGYVPWRSKARYGLALSPRYEGAKSLKVDGNKNRGKDSLVWDASINYSYTINAQYALGVNYTDQTLVGPVHNSLLNRSLGIQFQIRWL